MTRVNCQTACLYLRTLAIVAAVLIGSASSANDELKPATEDAAPIVRGQEKSDEQCTWACLRWTKLCNVDPRGVYKCRRSCADFGEVCE